jgi:hypothetical protein
MNDPREFDYYKIHKESGSSRCVVKGYGQHPKHSVCYPNTRVVFLDSFATEYDARKAYPMLPSDGTEWSSKFFDRELTRMPTSPPADFDPYYAGESWDEE